MRHSTERLVAEAIHRATKIESNCLFCEIFLHTVVPTQRIFELLFTKDNNQHKHIAPAKNHQPFAIMLRPGLNNIEKHCYTQFSLNPIVKCF